MYSEDLWESGPNSNIFPNKSVTSSSIYRFKYIDFVRSQINFHNFYNASLGTVNAYLLLEIILLHLN